MQWTVFVKGTGKAVKTNLTCETECQMWIAAQPNSKELGYAPF